MKKNKKNPKLMGKAKSLGSAQDDDNTIKAAIAKAGSWIKDKTVISKLVSKGDTGGL